MSEQDVKSFLGNTSRAAVIRGPPGLSVFGKQIPYTASQRSGSQVSESFQLGEVVHIPFLYNQVIQGLGSSTAFDGLMENSNWQSWSGDPSHPVGSKMKNASGIETSMTKSTKGNTTKGPNTYQLEFWYAGKAKTFITDPADGYTVLDVSTEPQDIFDNIYLTPSTSVNLFTVKGYRLGIPLPSNNYFYKFKAYFVRQVVYTSAYVGALNETKHRYFIMFVPISSNSIGGG